MIFDFNNDCYKAFVNLRHRTDRLNRLLPILEKAGINADRFEAIKTSDHEWDFRKWGTMLKGTPGAIGCYVSQMGVMQSAYAKRKSALVMEDDLIICSDFQDRMRYIEGFLSRVADWDIFWLGATVSVNPPYWHCGRWPSLNFSALMRDADTTSDPRILRTYGCFCTYAYIVNHKSIPKILTMLENLTPVSIGIDWSMIAMQPNIYTYCFVPGCIMQYDNPSDIGVGETIFSNFLKLNGTFENSAYVYQDRMDQFDPNHFNWAEAYKNKIIV